MIRTRVDARGRDDEALPGAPAGSTPTTPKPIGACCKVAPPVLVYDQAGNLLTSWGGSGQGYDWPDRRSTLEVLTSFGDGGRGPGQFFGVHNLATDSKGNLYATETYTGARVQRFIFKGVAPVTKRNQGVVWPKP